MSVGKYSPTIRCVYPDNRVYEQTFYGHDSSLYDDDGFDSYGYDENGVDRDGHTERYYAEADLPYYGYFYFDEDDNLIPTD
jgi:hypothetical protein